MKDDRSSKPITFSGQSPEMNPDQNPTPTITDLGITLAIVLVLLRIFREFLGIYREWSSKKPD